MRKTWMVLTVLVVSSLADQPAGAQSTPAEKLKSFTVGVWHVSAWAFPGTKRINYCSGTTILSVDGEAAAFLNATSDQRWSVGFLIPKPQFTLDDVVPIDLAIEGGAPTLLAGRAISFDLARAEIASSPPSSLERFNRDQMVTITGKSESFTYKVPAAPGLVSALRACAAGAPD